MTALLDRLRGTQKEASLDDMSSEVRQAFRSAVGENTQAWVREVYTDYVIACVDNGDYYRIPYTRTDNGIEFNGDEATEVEQSWSEVAKTVVIEKADDERHVAFGWAYVMNKDGEQVTDHSGEFIDDVSVLEDTAYVFNLNYREGDERHTETVKAFLVESWVSTPEKLEAMGLEKDAIPTGWWTGWYVPDDEMWGKVRDGEYPMLSIGGYAQRESDDG